MTGTERCAPGARGAPRVRAGLRRGASLIEVMIALCVVAVGVLALAGIGPVFARLQRKGSGFTQGAVTAQSRFDSLASVPCHTIPLNATVVAVTRGVRERWTVTAGYQVLNVTDSVKVAGLARSIGYLSVIPCRN